MKIQPFCCDITIGTIEEQEEFKRLLMLATPNLCWSFNSNYYGYDKNGLWDYWYSKQSAINNFTRIIPLSEGIKILKQVVGDEKTTYTEQEIDFAYLAGVFNVSGIDGVYNEIQRLKSLGKNPHDIINEGRKQNP